MKGAGRTGTKGQIEVDVFQEAGEEFWTRINLGKIVADGLYVRTGLLLLLFEDYRQDRIARVNAVKSGQEVLSGYVQQWPGVRAVEQAAGQRAVFIPQATLCGFVIKGAAPGAVSSLDFEKFLSDRGGRRGQRLEGQFT